MGRQPNGRNNFFLAQKVEVLQSRDLRLKSRILNKKMFVICLLLLSSFLPVRSLGSTSLRGFHKRLERRGKRDTTKVTDGSATSKVISTVIDSLNVTEEDEKLWDTYQEVKTHALLKMDQKGPLPTNFSICFAIFTTRDDFHVPLTVLGKDDSLLFDTTIDNDETINASAITLALMENAEEYTNAELIPKVFPGQWVRNCLAISLQTGSIKWVLDGILVHDITSNLLRGEMAGKILIGAAWFPSGWAHFNSKVTGVNIFSSALSVSAMKARTEHKIEDCEESGDYLSWDEMEWEVHGNVRLETVEEKRPCKSETDILLFYTEFAIMSECMYHCEKLKGRAPKIVTKKTMEQSSEIHESQLLQQGRQHNVGPLDVSDQQKQGRRMERLL